VTAAVSRCCPCHPSLPAAHLVYSSLSDASSAAVMPSTAARAAVLAALPATLRLPLPRSALPAGHNASRLRHSCRFEQHYFIPMTLRHPESHWEPSQHSQCSYSRRPSWAAAALRSASMYSQLHTAGSSAAALLHGPIQASAMSMSVRRHQAWEGVCNASSKHSRRGHEQPPPALPSSMPSLPVSRESLRPAADAACGAAASTKHAASNSRRAKAGSLLLGLLLGLLL
jgi:hypothetical protein